jgi:hypothetical protein
MIIQKSFQRLALAAVVCTFIAMSFTSCYRGHGCPGQITQQPEKHRVVEGDC